MEKQLELPLPKPPVRRFSLCPRCDCIHTSKEQEEACREYYSRREQK